MAAVEEESSKGVLIMAEDACVLSEILPPAPRDRTEPSPPLSYAKLRNTRRNSEPRAELSREELRHLFERLFEIADLLRWAGASAEICDTALAMAKLYWRYETGDYFRGVYAG